MSERTVAARINLIGCDNGRGLGHDLRLLRETLLALGYEVHFSPAGATRRRFTLAALALRARLVLRWLRHGAQGSWKFDANIMLEHVRPAYFGVARCNLFIPNPEWLSPRDERHLPRFDAVFTKTRVATDTFHARGLRTLQIGFRSSDCLQPEVPRQPCFLHLAGASPMKGTARLLALWRRHPQWPPLLVLQSPLTAAGIAAAPAQGNLEHRITTVRDIARIRHLQNSYRFHLCLSEAEGWGHYIAEAMSCGAVVITCDAPPMNELVRPDRGLLVRASEAGKLNASNRYHFDEAALEGAIEQLMATDTAQCERLGAAARAWFEANQRSFAGRLQDALRQVL